MATWPANGAENWNTTMLAYLAIEHNTDGTHKVQTVLTDDEAQFTYASVAGSPTKVYTKFLTGTLDADTSTTVAHGITGIDKILSVASSVYDDAATRYKVGNQYANLDPNPRRQVSYDGTNVYIDNVGTVVQGNKYRLRIDYIL